MLLSLVMLNDSELKIGGAKHLLSQKRSFPPVRMTRMITKKYF